MCCHIHEFSSPSGVTSMSCHLFSRDIDLTTTVDRPLVYLFIHPSVLKTKTNSHQQTSSIIINCHQSSSINQHQHLLMAISTCWWQLIIYQSIIFDNNYLPRLISSEKIFHPFFQKKFKASYLWTCRCPFKQKCLKKACFLTLWIRITNGWNK